MLRLISLLSVLLQFSALIAKDPDFYKILDVSKHADARAIKKAFRKGATKYHPDKNAGDQDAHDKFVEINRAYSVLSDEDSRRAYDRYGHEGLEQHEKQETARKSRGSRGGGMFGNFFGQSQADENPEDMRGEDITADLWLHLHEVYNGIIYDLSIFRQTLCPHCFGSGADSDEHIKSCPKCGGSGTTTERRQIGVGFYQQVQTTCDKCGGSGKIVKKQCRVCGGSGVHEGSHTYWVEIQRGTPDGYQLFMENEGDETRDAKGGHLTWNIKTFKNTDRRTTGFERDADNADVLHYYLQINLLQALLGYDVNITHMDGHTVNVREEDRVTKPLSVRTIVDEGMPVFGSYPTRFGVLHVHFEVVLPNELSEQQRLGIDRLL